MRLDSFRQIIFGSFEIYLGHSIPDQFNIPSVAEKYFSILILLFGLFIWSYIGYFLIYLAYII